MSKRQWLLGCLIINLSPLGPVHLFGGMTISSKSSRLLRRMAKLKSKVTRVNDQTYAFAVIIQHVRFGLEHLPESTKATGNYTLSVCSAQSCVVLRPGELLEPLIVQGAYEYLIAPATELWLLSFMRHTWDQAKPVPLEGRISITQGITQPQRIEYSVTEAPLHKLCRCWRLH